MITPCVHCGNLGEAGTVCTHCGGRGCHADSKAPYTVRIIETVTYLFTVEAENAEAAKAEAEEAWCNVESRDTYFEAVDERVIDGVLK